MKCENLTFDSSEDGLSKEVQRYIGKKLHNTCIEYGDISGIAHFPFDVISRDIRNVLVEILERFGTIS